MVESGVSCALSRRQLLQFGLTAGVGSMLVPRAWAMADTQRLPLSVGWVEGSDAWPYLRPLPWEPLPSQGIIWPEGVADTMTGFRIQPADGIGADGSLAGRWVVVRIFGLYPGLPAAELPGFRSVNLIHWQAPGDGAELPVLVWGGRRAPGRSTASPVSYPYLLGENGLRFTIEQFGSITDRTARLTGSGVPTRVFEGQITVDMPGPGLRRGAYFLGLEPGLWGSGQSLMSPEDPLAHVQTSIVLSVDPLEESA